MERSVSPVQWAHRYANLGWLVFPVHSAEPGRCSCGNPACHSPGKHPRSKEGLKDGTTEHGRIDEWWARWPEANIGIVTGARSGIVVIDVDVGKDGEATLSALEASNGQLPTTLTAATGSGGLHYLFRHPGSEVRNSAGKLGPGLDVRDDGGYIVAAPSRHVSGGCYSWLFGPQQSELGELPSWLLALAVQTPARAGGPGSASPDVIREGGRNMELARIAGSLRSNGLGQGELQEALRAINRDRVVPPLFEAEVDAIAASVARYPVRRKLTEYGAAERLIDRHGPISASSPGWAGMCGTELAGRATQPARSCVG